MNNSLIRLENITKSFDDGKANRLVIFKDLDFSVSANKSICIQGSSGSGKTTLLHLLSGLSKPTKGRILFENQDFNNLSDSKKSMIRNQYIGFVYQFHHLIQEFNIFENIILPIQISRKLNKKDKVWVDYLLDRLGIMDKKNHFPSELSGGQRQRVAIARALVNQPKCLIADEPTGNLDEQNAQNIGNLLIELQKEQKSTLIIATHDHNLAHKCEEIFELRDKKFIQK